MTKFLVALVLIANFYGSSAFWGLPTDLQLGYEIYDKSNEINAVIQAVASESIRLNVVSNDDKTRNAQSGLIALAQQLRVAPVALFGEIAVAAASRSANDGNHIDRILLQVENSFEALNFLTNSSSPLGGLADVTNPTLMKVLGRALENIQKDIRRVEWVAKDISSDVALVRANASLLLTPELLNNFINQEASAIFVETLANIRNNFTVVSIAVKDAARLVTAHGSIHDLLTRSLSQDTTTRGTALKNFVNNYSRLRNSVLTSVVTLKQAVANDIKSFVARVQELYDDSIVRPVFEEEQLPVIEEFAKVIDERIYNKAQFQTSYDSMRDVIVNSYENSTESSASGWSDYRETILYVQRTLFVRKYSRCIDELVSDAETSSNKITGKQAFCLVERSSGIGVLLPGATTWLAAIRRNINFQIEMLNSCLNDEVDIASLYATSECIQSSVNNIVPYAEILASMVEEDLKGVAVGQPLLFGKCIKSIPVASISKFGEIYKRCREEVEPPTTTEAPTTTTTEEPTTTEASTTTTTTEESTTTNTEQPTTTDEPTTTTSQPTTTKAIVNEEDTTSSPETTTAEPETEQPEETTEEPVETTASESETTASGDESEPADTETTTQLLEDATTLDSEPDRANVGTTIVEMNHYQ